MDPLHVRLRLGALVMALVLAASGGWWGGAEASIHTYGREPFREVGNAFLLSGGSEGIVADGSDPASPASSFIKFINVTFWRTAESAESHAKMAHSTGLVQAILFEAADRDNIGGSAYGGQRSICCTPDLAKLEGCKQGEVIRRPSSDDPDWPVVVDTHFSANHLSVKLEDEEVRITKTGMYNLFFISCDPKLRGLAMSGKTVWRNPGGYLPGRMAPLMTFYVFMSLAYLLVMVVWFSQYIRFWRDILPIQNWITLVIALGLFEMTLWYFEYLNFNSSGVRPVGITTWVVTVGAIRKTISRLLILSISMGYGVVRPTLGGLTSKVLLLGLTYFLASELLDIAENVGTINDISGKAKLFLVLPDAFLDAFLILWIFTSLSRTLEKLQARRSSVKLDIYRKFTNALAVSVIASVVWIGYEVYFNADKQSVDDSRQCSGMGCCQTSIASNLVSSNITFDDKFNNSEVRGFNPCSYAFVAEQDWFRFEASYLEDKKFTEKFKDGVPTMLDWVAGNEFCDEAVKNVSTYACIGKNSQCIRSPNATGYLCTCKDGFAGNPYLEEGCEDINECSFPDQYPCNGICSNVIGDYSCSCKSGTQSIDPKRETCNPIAASERARLTKMFIGISACAILLLICIFPLLIECQKRKLVEEKKIFFQQNGGLLLYEQIRSKQVDTVRIFTRAELENATNNFDSSRELGRGGHGTVYKGILEDSRVVAIKSSKVMNMAQKDEFAQEMIILSQINHRNVVKLLGCCLEVEVPMLVYECIPNGTLFDLMHGKNRRLSLSLDTRLRIAQECAEALAYLHSSASPPIVHGDVKSPNILLGENYTAKVTDFGASRMLPTDEIQFMTMVQGTIGYLDPEYLQEHQLTEKSDVYSFGVVLLELITMKFAIYSDSAGERKNLASSFLMAMKENGLQFILDKNILEFEADLLQEVAQLAKSCLSMTGEERPLMTEVAERLKSIRVTWREQLIQNPSTETEYLLENSSHYDPSSTGQHRSLMALDLESGR